MRKIALLACVAAVASSAAWAADVTVAGLNAPHGSLAVDADTTVLTNGFNATLPSALAAEATLWFAADTNVIADENGGVTEWRDVREAANAETRLYKAALAYLPEERRRTPRRASTRPPSRIFPRRARLDTSSAPSCPRW